ncbi:hypothetical protein G184_gp34 [Erwinia phage ENT90]|uniref:Uncharacterized protein n=1 Tax=Erwinia phage ENT90 TaxID=947843 RepID=F1BUQ3_9CAUD|nr:hypothetical protein G184_gp34 [Erwinia phage ENT90]ADX32429.1 hypothetical protein [Erwinia phage ENT90]
MSLRIQASITRSTRITSYTRFTAAWRSLIWLCGVTPAVWPMPFVQTPALHWYGEVRQPSASAISCSPASDVFRVLNCGNRAAMASTAATVQRLAVWLKVHPLHALALQFIGFAAVMPVNKKGRHVNHHGDHGHAGANHKGNLLRRVAAKPHQDEADQVVNQRADFLHVC